MTEQRRSDDDLKIAEKIGAYLDGELSAEEVQEVEKFLATDASARKELEQFKSLLKMRENINVPEVSEAEWNSSFDAIMEKHDSASKQNVVAMPVAPQSQPVRLLALFAVAAALLLVFVLYGKPQVTPPNNDEPVIVGVDMDLINEQATMHSIELNDEIVDSYMYEQLDEDSFIVYVDVPDEAQ